MKGVFKLNFQFRSSILGGMPIYSISKNWVRLYFNRSLDQSI